jgi:hypothetical protein
MLYIRKIKVLYDLIYNLQQKMVYYTWLFLKIHEYYFHTFYTLFIPSYEKIKITQLYYL